MDRATFLASTGATLAATGFPPLPDVPGGKTFIVPFATAPYPHPSRANGHVYDGTLYDAATHYSDASAGIFVPDGWHPEGGAVDLVVHFYGWRHNVASTFAIYRLREQLVASKRNAILVVPSGPVDAPDSGDGKLENDENGFAHFVNDVCAWLQRSNISPVATPGKIVLSAHSGGYGGAGGVLTRGGMNAAISDVLLFDAAYAYYDAFGAWAQGANKHLLSIFTPTGGTMTGNVTLMGMLQASTPNIYVWRSQDLEPSRLQTRDATFILTADVAHDDVLTHDSWYGLFLQTTALGAL